LRPRPSLIGPCARTAAVSALNTPTPRLSGHLANIIEPWDVLAAHVDLVVRDPEQTPYCVGSDNAELHGILTREWDHDLVLSGVR